MLICRLIYLHLYSNMFFSSTCFLHHMSFRRRSFLQCSAYSKWHGCALLDQHNHLQRCQQAIRKTMWNGCWNDRFDAFWYIWYSSAIAAKGSLSLLGPVTNVRGILTCPFFAAWALHLEVTGGSDFEDANIWKDLKHFKDLKDFSSTFDLSFVSLWFERFCNSCHIFRFERWHGRYRQRCLCGQLGGHSTQTWRLPNVPTIPSPLRWWFAYNLYQLNVLVANLLGYVGIHFGQVGKDMTWSDHLPADHSCCFWAVKENL